MGFLGWDKRRTVKDSAPGDHIVIVGAGLSGLTSALYLLGSGYAVTVVEASDHVGGRCATEDVECTTPAGSVTARFDTGATVWTMPELVDNALAAVGTSMAEVDPSLVVKKMSPAYNAMFTDGRRLQVFGEPALMENQLRDFDPAAADTNIAGYRRLRSWFEGVFESSFGNFMSRSFDSPLNMVGDGTSIRDLTWLARNGAFGGLESKIRSFLPDELLSRVFSFQALYAGVTPRRARAVYGCISHMDTSMGVYYPLSQRWGSGLGVVPELLAAAVRDAGGTILTGTKVLGLDIDNDTWQVNEVVVSSSPTPVPTALSCDGVIATTDLPVVEEWLEDAGWDVPFRPVPLRFSPSAVVAHGVVPVDVAKKWPQSHHNISFGEHWNQTFEEISSPTRGRVMSDPSLLITRPAHTDPTRIVTDSNGTQWEPVSVLAPCPNLKSAEIDWASVTDAYIAEVTTELEERGFAGISTQWIAGKIDTPATWAEQGMGDGSPFGLAHLFRQTGPFRPRNFSDRMPGNIVLAGSTTVPGVGVPTVMVSGRLAAERFGTASVPSVMPSTAKEDEG
ncbi:phytoene desaturase family protein [Corynebacterium sp. H78]|uniref:phytoene desaturase family protein n=1 Tax=Corynebacterium sp. H78 TaxID=3133417 RepID=UPI0030A05FB6